MAKIIPFKAVRPTNDKVGLVTCRNYDDYSAAELAAWLNFNPYSFLHIINLAYLHAQKIETEKRFKSVANKYQDFKKDGVFLKEEKEVFYLYEIQNKNKIFTGIIAGASINDYQNNTIKKHEDTLEYRVNLFKDYLHQTGFNTEPVLITYPDKNSINSWILNKKKQVPLYNFSTTNKEKHTLWVINDSDEINWIISEFEKIPELYIADGHHRSASAELLYLQEKSTKNNNLNYFMSFFIAESNIKIYEYNRMVKDLNGLSKSDFIATISKHFDVVCKDQELWKPQNKFEFGMYLEGHFYALFYKNSFKSDNIIDNLDAQILYNYILKPVLGIEDLRNDNRIEYFSGTESIVTIKQLIDESEYKVGFMLYPSNIEEIKLLADNNLIMPPKSTYIEPKFRSGLVIHEH